MSIIYEVEVVLKENRGISNIKVRAVYTVTAVNGIRYLALKRLTDGQFGYIPMDLIETYRILNEEKGA